MAATDLPKFDRPPVVEAVLGVQFSPIKGLTNAHLGMAWQQLKPEWKKVVDAQSLDPQFEEFVPQKAWRPDGVQLRVSQDHSSRLLIRNEEDDRMIQVQNGRFILNWRGLSGGAYPTYAVLRPEFDEYFAKFCRILTNEFDFSEPSVNQWELTYVNHIPKGSVWNAPADWVSLFRGLPGPSATNEQLCLDKVSGEWSFEIVPQKGRLHVQLKHGGRKSSDASEMEELLALVLTARGPASENDDEASLWQAGLELGHEVLVRAFEKMTSNSAHEYWGLPNGSR